MKGDLNLFRQLDKLGNQRKASVCVPKLRGNKPNLVFKVPTCENRESSFSPVRQGGSYNLAAAGSYLIFLALTVKIFQARIIIDITTRFHNLFKNILIFHVSSQIRLSLEDLKEVDFINSEILHELILPSV